MQPHATFHHKFHCITLSYKLIVVLLKSTFSSDLFIFVLHNYISYCCCAAFVISGVCGMHVRSFMLTTRMYLQDMSSYYTNSNNKNNTV